MSKKVNFNLNTTNISPDEKKEDVLIKEYKIYTKYNTIHCNTRA